MEGLMTRSSRDALNIISILTDNFNILNNVKKIWIPLPNNEIAKGIKAESPAKKPLSAPVSETMQGIEDIYCVDGEVDQIRFQGLNDIYTCSSAPISEYNLVDAAGNFQVRLAVNYFNESPYAKPFGGQTADPEVTATSYALTFYQNTEDDASGLIRSGTLFSTQSENDNYWFCSNFQNDAYDNQSFCGFNIVSSAEGAELLPAINNYPLDAEIGRPFNYISHHINAKPMDELSTAFFVAAFNLAKPYQIPLPGGDTAAIISIALFCKYQENNVNWELLDTTVAQENFECFPFTELNPIPSYLVSTREPPYGNKDNFIVYSFFTSWEYFVSAENPFDFISENKVQVRTLKPYGIESDCIANLQLQLADPSYKIVNMSNNFTPAVAPGGGYVVMKLDTVQEGADVIASQLYMGNFQHLTDKPKANTTHLFSLESIADKFLLSEKPIMTSDVSMAVFLNDNQFLLCWNDGNCGHFVVDSDDADSLANIKLLGSLDGNNAAIIAGNCIETSDQEIKCRLVDKLGYHYNYIPKLTKEL